jgi:hypothetical protein
VAEKKEQAAKHKVGRVWSSVRDLPVCSTPLHSQTKSKKQKEVTKKRKSTEGKDDEVRGECQALSYTLTHSHTLCYTMSYTGHSSSQSS